MAEKRSLGSSEITGLIDSLLSTQDPAVVGLRRILKHKRELGTAFPCRSVDFAQLDTTRVKEKVFNPDERRVLELERQIQGLNQKLAQMEKELVTRCETARQTGYAAGVADGEKKGFEKGSCASAEGVDKLRQRVESVLATFEKSRRNLFSRSENALVALACDIARKVVATELTQNKDVVVAVVKNALAHLTEKDRLVIRIDPLDAPALESSADFWTPVNERLTDIRIEHDSRVGRGGCVIESPNGVVDARVEGQLIQLRDLVEAQWLSAATAPVPSAQRPQTCAGAAADQPNESVDTSNLSSET